MKEYHSLEAMKKAGRKPLPESKKRSHRLEVRVSKAELKQFEALAERMNAGLSETIRKAVAQVSA
jgi:hypothetical protein